MEPLEDNPPIVSLMGHPDEGEKPDSVEQEDEMVFKGWREEEALEAAWRQNVLEQQKREDEEYDAEEDAEEDATAALVAAAWAKEEASEAQWKQNVLAEMEKEDAPAKPVSKGEGDNSEENASAFLDTAAWAKEEASKDKEAATPALEEDLGVDAVPSKVGLDVSSSSSDFQFVEKSSHATSLTESPTVIESSSEIKQALQATAVAPPQLIIDLPVRPPLRNIGPEPVRKPGQPYKSVPLKERLSADKKKVADSTQLYREIMDHKKEKYLADSEQRAYDLLVQKLQITDRLQADRSKRLARDEIFVKVRNQKVAEYRENAVKRAAELEKQRADVRARIAEFDAKRRTKEAEKQGLIKMLS